MSVIIVVSGDVAFSGKKTEYNTAYSFFSQLKSKIKKEFNIEDIHFCIVPGNHDVDYKKGDLKHYELEKIFKENKQNDELYGELIKMNAFYNHANGMQCFSDKTSFVSMKEISVLDKTIAFNLINTAAYSSKEEDQGMHYLPEKDLLKLKNYKKCDYIFTVMHHPHHWFNWTMKKI